MKLPSNTITKIQEFKIKKTITIVSAISFVLATASPSLSANYDAICGDVDCQIGVSARGISGPGGFMPAGLVSIWNVGKASDFNTLTKLLVMVLIWVVPPLYWAMNG